MSPTPASKPNIFQRIVEAWPVIATVSAVAITWHIQVTLLDYRLTKAEHEIVEMREDAKENLAKLTSSVQQLQLDVQTLITLMRETKGTYNGFVKEK